MNEQKHPLEQDDMLTVAVAVNLGGLMVDVPMQQDPETGERFIRPNVADLMYEVSRVAGQRAEAHTAELTTLRQQAAALAEALAWYGERDNHTSLIALGDAVYSTPMIEDNGERARSALKARQ